MTSPSGPAAVGSVPGTSYQAGPEGDVRPEPEGAHPPGAGAPRRRDIRSAWPWLVPAVVTLVLSLWNISTPSFWRDEAATLAAVRRPFGDLISMLGNVDAVHAVYYMLMWPLVHLIGASELVLRLPSAIAMTVAAAAVAAIGKRLMSPWAGLAAGLLFAVLPAVSRYGQEGRSYAMVIAVAAIASYLLARLLEAGPADRRGWLIKYGVSLAVLGVLNIFALLLIPAHAVTVALHYRRTAADPRSGRLAVGWLLAAVVAVIVASPLLLLGWKQRGQIAWLSVNTSSASPITLLTLIGPALVSAAVVGVIAVAIVLTSETGRERWQATWPPKLIELAAPWLILPPAILLAGSLITPMYTSRYILMCIPALALVGGAAIMAFGRFAGPVALAVVLLAGISTQATQRGPAGHYDDIRTLDQIVTANARPGDVVLYTNPNAESFGAAYQTGLYKLPNIDQARAAIPSGTLAGTSVSLSVLRQRLLHVHRVWVVEINHETIPPDQPVMLNLGAKATGPDAGPIFQGLPYTLTQTWRARGDWILLFSRG